MGLALEVIGGQVTAPGATLTAWTMNAGNSLTIRNARIESRIQLLTAWAKNQAVGTLQIRSPKLHDNVRGIRLDLTAADPRPLLPYGQRQPLVAQDTLIAEQSGSAVAGDIEGGAFLVFYEDLPGSEARLLDAETVLKNMVQVLTVENTLATGVAGGWSGEEAINAESDLLKANTDYALLGYLVDTLGVSVRWRGADTGNLGVGGPSKADAEAVTAEWFLWLSKSFGIPAVPVFNAANKGGILIDAHQDENGTDITVSSIFAELPAGLVQPRR